MSLNVGDPAPEKGTANAGAQSRSGDKTGKAAAAAARSSSSSSSRASSACMSIRR